MHHCTALMACHQHSAAECDQEPAEDEQPLQSLGNMDIQFRTAHNSTCQYDHQVHNHAVMGKGLLGKTVLFIPIAASRCSKHA